MSVLAYHITWTTYGTWLHGDNRWWVKSGTGGIQDPDPEREQQAKERMIESAVTLSPQQRAIVKQTIRDHCRIRQWILHALNVRTNHVHLVVTAPDRRPEDVLNQFKA